LGPGPRLGGLGGLVDVDDAAVDVADLVDEAADGDLAAVDAGVNVVG
jgi:hypothetical protein